MRPKILLVVLMTATVIALLWVNRPRSEITAPAPVAQQSQALPSLPAHFAGHGSSQTAEAASTNSTFRQRLKNDAFPKLTAEQIEPYLLANHRSAESLLAAFMTTGDRALVREAMQKFPNDPQVAYAALYFGNLSPEEKRQWADTFKRVAPDNAMANYTSALDYLKSGQSDLAVQDVATAGNSKWADYSWQFMKSSEEAYRSAGYSDLDAKAAAQTQLLLPDLAQLKQLGVQLNDLAKSYQQNGNAASAQNLLQMDIQIGKQLSAVDAQPLITTLVGYAIEKIAFSSMDPNAPYGDTGQTVQDQLDQIKDQKTLTHSLVGHSEALESVMSDEDFLNFFQRRESFGELSALRWAINKYEQQ